MSNNSDLYKIKKHYGEDFAQLCRSLFPTILEHPGLLYETISKTLAPSHNIYNDVVICKNTFASFIFSSANIISNGAITTNKSPEQLMLEAGYILYPECKSAEEINAFKKYYTKEEQLCTFSDDRLASCRVWFAVKIDVDKIKRPINPQRQDAYGTSVISIQFSRGQYNILSIKNRYNHTVENPDATFDNDLDKIIEGLSYAFSKKYDLNLLNETNNLILYGFDKGDDGRFYKYNYQKNHISYCDNNVIIDNGKVIKLDPSRYTLVDYYIVDHKEKTIKLYDEDVNDCLPEIFKDKIASISITKLDKKHRLMKIKHTNGKYTNLTLDSYNTITEIDDEAIEEIGDKFMYWNTTLKKANFKNTKSIGKEFLLSNEDLEEIHLPSTKSIDDTFLFSNAELKEINLENCESIGNEFMAWNNDLVSFGAKKLKNVGDYFLGNNKTLETMIVPKLENIGEKPLKKNKILKFLYSPRLNFKTSLFLTNHPNLKDIIKNIKSQTASSNKNKLENSLDTTDEKLM